MIITRKAAIGFILLAMLIFPIGYFCWSPPSILLSPDVKNVQIQKPGMTLPEYKHDELTYHPPILSTKTPWEMAIGLTLIMEVFSFLCYWALKTIEPKINGAAEAAMRYIRNRVE